MRIVSFILMLLACSSSPVFADDPPTLDYFKDNVTNSEKLLAGLQAIAALPANSPKSRILEVAGKVLEDGSEVTIDPQAREQLQIDLVASIAEDPLATTRTSMGLLALVVAHGKSAEIRLSAATIFKNLSQLAYRDDLLDLFFNAMRGAGRAPNFFDYHLSLFDRVVLAAWVEGKMSESEITAFFQTYADRADREDFRKIETGRRLGGRLPLATLVKVVDFICGFSGKWGIESNTKAITATYIKSRISEDRRTMTTAEVMVDTKLVDQGMISAKEAGALLRLLGRFHTSNHPQILFAEPLKSRFVEVREGAIRGLVQAQTTVGYVDPIQQLLKDHLRGETEPQVFSAAAKELVQMSWRNPRVVEILRVVVAETIDSKVLSPGEKQGTLQLLVNTATTPERKAILKSVGTNLEVSFIEKGSPTNRLEGVLLAAKKMRTTAGTKLSLRQVLQGGKKNAGEARAKNMEEIIRFQKAPGR